MRQLVKMAQDREAATKAEIAALLVRWCGWSSLWAEDPEGEGVCIGQLLQLAQANHAHTPRSDLWPAGYCLSRRAAR